MATFRITSTIYVRDIDTAQDAIDVLRAALDEYESITGRPVIIISHEEPKFVMED